MSTRVKRRFVERCGADRVDIAVQREFVRAFEVTVCCIARSRRERAERDLVFPEQREIDDVDRTLFGSPRRKIIDDTHAQRRAHDGARAPHHARVADDDRATARVVAPIGERLCDHLGADARGIAHRQRNRRKPHAVVRSRMDASTSR